MTVAILPLTSRIFHCHVLNDKRKQSDFSEHRRYTLLHVLFTSLSTACAYRYRTCNDARRYHVCRCSAIGFSLYHRATSDDGNDYMNAAAMSGQTAVTELSARLALSRLSSVASSL
jgi:hypothetical protein